MHILVIVNTNSLEEIEELKKLTGAVREAGVQSPIIIVDDGQPLSELLQIKREQPLPSSKCLVVGGTGTRRGLFGGQVSHMLSALAVVDIRDLEVPKMDTEAILQELTKSFRIRQDSYQIYAEGDAPDIFIPGNKINCFNNSRPHAPRKLPSTGRPSYLLNRGTRRT